MTFNYCPQCGTKGSVSSHSTTAYTCNKCDWRFWNNPHGTATAIFLNEKHEVLLVERGIEPHKGKYDLPGGFLEYQEQAKDALIREMQEELGVTPLNPQLFDHAYGSEYIPHEVSTVDLFYVVTRWEGTFTPQDDVTAYMWMPIETIESDQFAWGYPGFVQQLHKYIARNNL